MANSTDSVSSWPGLLSQLNKTFLLIRDLFGYALPGGVFLAVGVISKRFTLVEVQNLLNWYHPPIWALLIILIATCYVVGDILATITYLPIAIRKWWQWHKLKMKKHLYPLRDASAQSSAVEPEAEEIDLLLASKGIESTVILK